MYKLKNVIYKEFFYLFFCFDKYVEGINRVNLMEQYVYVELKVIFLNYRDYESVMELFQKISDEMD